MSYTVPTYEMPLNQKGQTNSVWYRFFQALYAGQAPSNEVSIPLGATPFSYTAPSRGWVLVNGGTVSAVQFTRSVTTLTGQTQGIFPVSQGDVLTVTYTGTPALLFVPQ